MTDQELAILKSSIKTLKDIALELNRIRYEVEEQMQRVRNEEDRLVQLLPTDDRLHRLLGGE